MQIIIGFDIGEFSAMIFFYGVGQGHLTVIFINIIKLLEMNETGCGSAPEVGLNKCL